MTTLLWPRYAGPADLADVESVPLAERGLPPSTYALVARAAELWPDRIAMSVLAGAAQWNAPVTITYAALAARVHAFANALSACGVGRRDAVALLAPNCAELPVALLASEAVGVVSPLNPALAAGDVVRLLAVSGARVPVAAGPDLSSELWEKARHVAKAAGISTLLALRPTVPPEVEAALAPLDGVRVAYLGDLAATERTDALGVAPPAADDLAAYFHTGGTTGLPKLAAHTHANEVADAWMVALGEFLGDEPTLFAALPLFHVNALVVTLLAPIFRGQHVVWAGPLGYREPMLYGVFWRLVERYRVTAMSGVPTVYAALAQVPVDADLSSLRLVIVGASPLPPAVRAAWKARTGTDLAEGYGLTEATCASARNFPGAPRDGSVGQRMPYQHVKIVAIDPATGKRVDRPAGAAGILMISGPTVFPGYVTMGPEGPVLDGASKLEDGWLDTGDLATVDADGYITLTGRAKDLIIRGGHNIDPIAVEDALLSHPRVTGANVVGSPDPHAGEVPVAYVTLRPGDALDPAALVAWAAEHVPERAAAPRAVFVLPALPVTEVGKPYKPELRRDATERALAAALGPDVAVKARLVDGAVVVEIAADAPASVDTVLDGYPVTWRRRGAP